MRVSPWIHVESEGRHLGFARVGDRLEMRAKVKRLFEKKGHEFVELDLLLVAEGTRPIASIRHVAIYQLPRIAGRGEGSAARREDRPSVLPTATRGTRKRGPA